MTGSLRIKTLPSGKSYYYVKLNYKDSKSGLWKSKTLATKLEVKNNKRKAETIMKKYLEQYAYLEEMNLKEGFLNPDVRICECLDGWLCEKKRDLRTSTYEAYSYRVKCIKKYFSHHNYKMVEITPGIIDTFFKYALKYGKENQKTKQKEPLAVRTVRSYKSILYAMFNQAMIDGLIKTNPVSGVVVHGKKNEDYGEDFLFMTEEEIAELLSFIAKKYPRLLGICFFGAYYGLRRSEILGLKWSAINFEKKTITINHTIVRVKTVNAADATKTVSGKRVLYLFETAEKCLRKIQKEQEYNKRFFKNEYINAEGYVFTWEDGRTYNPDYISKLFSKATKEFGRPEITLHKLRHSCASILINKGWDIKKLQYWLGHTDTQTTLNIYAHFNRQRLNASENDLAEISKDSAKLFEN